MNRLILIGNGFDLAHGLKTCYKDFILWYIHGCFIYAHENSQYEDELILIKRTPYFYNDAERRSQWVTEYLSKIKDQKEAPGIIFWGDENRAVDTSPYNISFKSKLLQPLLISCNVSNWVDIEGEYYDLLRAILEIKNVGERQSQLLNLNKSMSFIISKLEEYLLTLPTPPYLKGYEEIFSSSISAGDLYPKKSNRSVDPKETLILNFNYTNTVERYVNNMAGSTDGPFSIVNYIHGKLQDIDNELVFGFGDEIDAAYKKMEDDQKVKGYFDYIKSFWYLRTDNYRTLVNFLDADDYQVFVLGHSCGLSDRTMLQMIFEHERCRSIKIYFYKHDNVDNFVSLTHEIARHFKDKGLMRKKIKSKRGSDPMPQHDD